MTSVVAGYPRVRQRPRFVLLPLASVALPLLMICVGGWIAWRTTWQDAAVQLERRADAGAEYASRFLAGYVVASGRVNDVLQGVADADLRAREGEFHAVVSRLIRELPQAAASYVIDRHGDPLVGATVFPLPRFTNAGDRDFFRALAATSPPTIYISQVFQGRLDGEWSFAISRRRTGAGNGVAPYGFDGVVNVLVNPDIVAAGLRRLLEGSDDVMTMLRADGQILARSDATEVRLPPFPDDSPFFAIAASPDGVGVYRSASPIDGVVRLVATRRVDGFPVFVLAGRSRAAIIAEWRERLAFHLIFGVPATLALLALSLRVRRSQLRLAADNAELEQALGQSDARLQRVQSAGGVLSFEAAPDGSLICDNEFRALWGTAPDIRLDFADLMERVHPDDQAGFLATYHRLSREGGSFTTELRVILPDGAENWLMTLGEASAGPNDRPSRIVGVTMDITPRKRIEAAMHDRETRLRELVATLDLATVMVRNFDGTIGFWSEGCARLFGWTAGEAFGQKSHDLLRTIPPVPGEEIEAQLLAAGEWNGDLRQFHRDGTEIIIAARKVLRRDGAGKPVAIMITLADVTALRQTRIELEQVNHRLESLVRDEVAKREAAQLRAAHAERIQALGQLAGGIAHDLNNVLQAVTSGASLASRDAENPERVRRLSRLMGEAAQRGAAVTRRLLSFSRRADLHAEPIEPRALLTDLEEVLAHTLGGHVRCVVNAPAGLARLLADRGQLETALVNLATNARDAMPNGGIIVLSAAEEIVEDPITHPGMVPPGRYIRLTVADSGTGMDAATLARVPEPFFTTKREGSGTGLGLAMVSGFAQQSGGALGIESAPGQGTTVSLWLPEAIDPPPRAAVADAGKDPTRPARVLLVDDDAMVRDILVQQLEAVGYGVTVAQDGPQALDRLADGLELDVLICDLSMPGMGGLAVIREAQTRRAGLPAILLTGYVGDSAALPTEGAQFAVLRKPATTTQLADSIALLLSAQGAGSGSKSGDLPG